MTDATDQFEWDQCNARIEHLILVPAAISQGENALPDAFSEEFCENMPERADAPLWAQCKALARFAAADETPEPWEVVDALAIGRANGFLIQAAQPVVTHFFKDGNGFSYSWGYYHTEWLYAETAADISRVVDEWSVATLERDRAKAADKDTDQ